jgi:hypothetical protein
MSMKKILFLVIAITIFSVSCEAQSKQKTYISVRQLLDSQPFEKDIEITIDSAGDKMFLSIEGDTTNAPLHRVSKQPAINGEAPYEEWETIYDSTIHKRCKCPMYDVYYTNGKLQRVMMFDAGRNDGKWFSQVSVLYYLFYKVRS